MGILAMSNPLSVGGWAILVLGAWVASHLAWRRRPSLPAARRRRELAIAAAQGTPGPGPIDVDPLLGDVRLKRVRMVDRSWAHYDFAGVLTLAAILFAVAYAFLGLLGGVGIAALVLAAWAFAGRSRRRKTPPATFPLAGNPPATGDRSSP